MRHFVRCATNSKSGVQSHGGTTCFQHERDFVLIMSSLNFYWLRVHLVLAAAKPAVRTADVSRVIEKYKVQILQ